MGKEIKSVALIADGHHARTYGFSSLAMLFWVFCVWLGHPLADPLIGLLFTIAIIRIVWEVGNSVFSRLLTGETRNC